MWNYQIEMILAKNNLQKDNVLNSTLNSIQLKQTKLRAGHTYDRKINKIMDLTDSNLCDICQVLANDKHIKTTFIVHINQKKISEKNTDKFYHRIHN